MSKTQKIIVTVILVALVTGIAFCGVSWHLTQQDLDSVRAELSSTQTALESNKRELSEIKDGLLATKTKLLVTEAEFSATKTKLQETKAELLVTEAEFSATKVELSETKAELLATSNDLSSVEAELLETKTRLSAIETDMFHLHNPTFEEVAKFLREDKTDSNKYIKDEYVCAHFAQDVNNNADSQGIRCAFVDIRFPDSAHAIIAFETTDEGMVYFDPITDERVKPVIGKEYWRCIQPRPGYHYEKPSYDDTIVDILVIW